MQRALTVSLLAHAVFLLVVSLASSAFRSAPPAMQAVHVDLSTLVQSEPLVSEPIPETPVPEPVPAPLPDPPAETPLRAPDLPPDEAPPESAEQEWPALRPPEPGLPRAPLPPEAPESSPAGVEDVDFPDPESVVPPPAPEPAVAPTVEAAAEEVVAGGTVQASATEGVEDAYLRLVQQKIGRRWEVVPAYARGRSHVETVISFRIGADGRVLDPTVKVSSGLSVFDRQAQRAVLDASPLPRPPARFGDEGIRINFSFVYNP